MGSLNFTEDLKIGLSNEEIVIKVFDEEYSAKCVGKSNKENKNLKEFDLIFNFPTKQNVVAEVKTEDRWVQPGKILPNGAYFPGIDTGNLCIEYRMYEKDSGIKVTTSDLWVIVFMNIGEVWTIKTKNLKKLIEENNFMTKIGGDEFYPNTTIPIPEEKRSHMYLIPRKDFKNHFTVNYFEV
jgi:hypothetical protein